MEHSKRLGRRTIVRIVSFTAALILVLAGSTISGYTLARRHRTTIEYGYQRALAALSEYIGNMDITLEKGKYATSPNQLEGLSAKLWREASMAKSTLGQLPVSGSELANTYKFLSQVGDFCLSLSRRVELGGTVTEDEIASLQQLTKYAQQVSGEIAGMESRLAAGSLQLGEVAAVMGDEDTTPAAPDLNSGFREMEEGFEDYPTLIYDGPFSDHIQQQKPKFLTGKAEVDAETARKRAAAVSGNKDLERTTDRAGNLPAYIFIDDHLRVSVTKAGGLVDYFLSSRRIDEAKLSVEQALNEGERAMKRLGYDGFAYRYYDLNNGVLTINYAYSADGVIYYPDLVKVGIAMDNGDVVLFDAQGYIFNHTTRVLATPQITAEQARQKLSKRLTVKGEPALALIPTESLNERLCYEFSCTGEDGERVLVYINVETGLEEQILILIENDLGVLAM